jgi:hypothetical protein
MPIDATVEIQDISKLLRTLEVRNVCRQARGGCHFLVPFMLHR